MLITAAKGPEGQSADARPECILKPVSGVSLGITLIPEVGRPAAEVKVSLREKGHAIVNAGWQMTGGLTTMRIETDPFVGRVQGVRLRLLSATLANAQKVGGVFSRFGGARRHGDMIESLTPTWMVTELTVVNLATGAARHFAPTDGVHTAVVPLKHSAIELRAHHEPAPVAAHGRSRMQTATIMLSTVNDEMWENERRLTQWSTYTAKSLFASDPSPFSSRSGRSRQKTAAPPVGWRWVTEWEAGENDWEYSFGFDRGSWSIQSSARTFVRRRKWTRIRKLE
jgi:hypothetical protein